MNQYLFVLGNAFFLCEKELLTTLERLHISYQKFITSPPIVYIETNDSIDPKMLINRLGGTIKIAKVEDSLSNFSEDEIANIIARKIDKNIANIGLSNYSQLPMSIARVLAKVKKMLAHKGQSLRYVTPQKDQVLSSVVVKKQALLEFIITQIGKDWSIAMTMEVQDSDEWSKRDYGRPHAAPKTGMLPPKVARMMVNLAINLYGKFDAQNMKLLDPFCGMGTVLSEALILGCRVEGIDISDDVTNKAKENLDWLTHQYSNIARRDYQIQTGDAVHAVNLLSPESIDVIVTEPYLGESFEKVGDKLYQRNKETTSLSLKNLFRGLTKLYKGALKNWHQILRPDGVIVIVLPKVTWKTQEFSVKKMVDSCEKLGYTNIAGSLEYSRPQAIIRRQIYIFRKN